MEIDLEDMLHAARQHDVALEIDPSKHSRSTSMMCACTPASGTRTQREDRHP
jgi:hypothetical protein